MNKPIIFNQYIVEELETPEQKFAGYKCSSRVEGNLGRVYKNKQDVS